MEQEVYLEQKFSVETTCSRCKNNSTASNLNRRNLVDYIGACYVCGFQLPSPCTHDWLWVRTLSKMIDDSNDDPLYVEGSRYVCSKCEEVKEVY